MDSGCKNFNFPKIDGRFELELSNTLYLQTKQLTA